MYEAFGEIAGVLERDRTWVMLRALRQYLETEGGTSSGTPRGWRHWTGAMVSISTM